MIRLLKDEPIGPAAATVIAVAMIVAICLLGGCASAVDRQQVANTLHQADAYAAAIETGLAPSDPLLPGIREVRREAELVIELADAWASGSDDDPTAHIWALLDVADRQVSERLDGDRLITAKRVLLSLRVSLLASGLKPPEPATDPTARSEPDDPMPDARRSRPDARWMQRVPTDRVQDGRSVSVRRSADEQQHGSQRQHREPGDGNHTNA